MDARGPVSSCSFVVLLILSIGARCGRGVVGGTALISSNPTMAAYLASESNAKLTNLSREDEEVVEGTAPLDHEDPRDRPSFDWSKASQAAARVDFVPTKLYAQVRRRHTVKHLPREDAPKSAASDEEEILAAPRLREVVSKSKTNTIYTEEGYEDAAYDHGAHVRDAEFQEGHDKKIGHGEEEEPMTMYNHEELENLWPDASLRSTLNTKDLTENEIERLEEDLESEYAESDKKVDIGVPEEPKIASSGEDEEEEEIGEGTAASLTDVDNVSTSLEPFAEYGKVLWDYLKSTGKKDNEAVNSSSSAEEKSSVVGGSTLANIRSPATKFDDSFPSERRIDAYPPAASLYEAWKGRQDSYGNSDESREFASFDSYTPRSEDEHFEDHTMVNVQNVEGSTTLVGPKKLSHTIIIRPSVKTPTATPSCPCNRQVEATGHGERTLVVKSFPREEFPSREAVNDFSNENDFTGVRPVSASRQVTYADFPPDSYPSPTQPSVAREIETSNGLERSPHEQSKNSYPNRGRNVRGNRVRDYRKKPRLVFRPVTRLVPPVPDNGNKYSPFLHAKATKKGKKEKKTGRKWWPEMMRFYRSFERRMFGRRRRSVAGDVSGEKKMPRKRNRFDETDRSVGPENAREEKSNGNNAGDERLLREAPRIVDRVINDEIEARFKEDERDDDEDEDDEKNDGIEVRGAKFTSSEVFDEDEDEKATKYAFVDLAKYPFYANSKVGRSSALKYATDPRKIPHKTSGGTEFYDSRDTYRECDEVRPKLEIPSSEENGEDSSAVRGQPRLRGLGESLDCFRGKYLDDDPLDNPLFLEAQVGQPRLPEQLDPRKLHLTISEDPNSEEYVRAIRRISRRPRVRKTSRTSPYSRRWREGSSGEVTNYFGSVSVRKRSVNNEEQSSFLVSNATTNNNDNEMRIVYTIRDRTGGSKSPSDMARGRRVTTVGRKRVPSGPEKQQPVAALDSVESSTTKNANTFDQQQQQPQRRRRQQQQQQQPQRRRQQQQKPQQQQQQQQQQQEPQEQQRQQQQEPQRQQQQEPQRQQQQQESQQQEPQRQQRQQQRQQEPQQQQQEPQQQQQRNLDKPNEMHEINGKRRTDVKVEETVSDSGGRIESTEQEPRGELREYLRSDPPGYTAEEEEGEEGASGNESSDVSVEKAREDFRDSEGYENSEESRESRSPSGPRVADEDSEKEFKRFASRPFSPFESYEDPKYTELGPRVSKPSFHHPSFSSVSANRRLGYPSGEWASDERDERDEAKSRFTFPWDRSDEEEESKEESRRRIDRHEYPWERRSRLARERHKRAKERERRERLYGFDEDEDDASETKTIGRFAYPWEGRHRLPSRIYGRKGRISDNEETSSVARPRFSSRYKTNIARVDEDEKDDPQVRTTGPDNREKKISATKPFDETNGTLVTWKKPIRRKIATPSTLTTTESSISRTSSTRKALVRKRKNGRVANVRIDLSGGPKFVIKTRGRVFEPSSTTTSATTAATNPVRRRFRKKNHVDGATSGGPGAGVTEGTTVGPKVKTVEHRSRFSKERLITKTSYPAFNDTRPGERAADAAEKTTPRISNETVREVSIMTKETTPDRRVYRAQKIDDNGVTDTFVTVVTSKNGTNSSSVTIVPRMMLESFEESDKPDETDEDSFARDTRLLANLLTHVPPYTNRLTTLAEVAGGSDDLSEGSGSLPDEYEKHPERRLYFYIHDL